MPTNDFLPVATAGGANVMSQSDYLAEAARTAGVTAGTAKSALANKSWRQSAAIAAMIGQLINDYAGLDALDDGNIGNLETAFARTLQGSKWSYVVATGTANAWVVAPTPALAAYAAGRVLWVKAPATNTATTVTVNISGLGTRPLKKADATDPGIGDIISGRWYPTIDDGTNVCIVAPLPSDMRAGSLLVTRVVITATGAGTWTVPNNVTVIRTKSWGAGGGGGYSTIGAASGGGSGAYVEKVWPVSPGQTISFNIGVGGQGGSASPAQSGQPGGNTTVTVGGTTVTAGGGGGGNNGSTSNGIANSPAGGAPTGGDINLSGMPGPYGTVANGGQIVGGNGGGAPNGGQIVPGGQGSAAPGATPGGGGAASGNSSFAGATGARGEIWIEY